MNANLVHKFPITDEEYNPVEEGVLNVKQRVANDSAHCAAIESLFMNQRASAWSL